MASLAGGCRISVEPDGSNVDAGDGVDAPPGVGTGFAMCGANMCVDLAHPQNAGLAAVGGNRVIPISGDKILVVRTTATTFNTTSAVCTHAGCTVRYVAASTSFACPCHGSKFALDGAVTQNPATRALKVFTHDFDEPGMMLTITL